MSVLEFICSFAYLGLKKEGKGSNRLSITREKREIKIKEREKNDID